MLSLPWLYLVIAFSFWSDFMMHQGSHMFQIKTDMRNGVQYGPGLIGAGLLFYQIFGTLAGLALLAFYGYRTHWYAPIVVVAASLVGDYLIRRIEIATGLMPKKAWIFSLMGFIVIPISLFFAFMLVYAN